MPYVPRIELPQGAQLRGKLEKKLEEYKFRMGTAGIDDAYKAPEQMETSRIIYYDSLYKSTVLERLLADGAVDVVKLEKSFKKLDAGLFRRAVSVINDYCATGGARCFGGTGLENN